MTDLNIFLAFGAGVLSFVSPCTIPLYPGFLSYITGVSIDELKTNRGMFRWSAILHTVFFLIGFSLIFIVLGFSTSFIGNLFRQYDTVFRDIGAIVIFFFGLVALGMIRPQFLMKNKKVTFQNRPSGYFGSILIGLGFAAGWTPCMGTILAAVLGLAVSNPDPDIPYMMAYVLGFAVPFFVFSFFIGKLKWFKKHSMGFEKAGGAIMVVMSVFLYFNWMTNISSFLTNRVFGGFTGF